MIKLRDEAKPAKSYATLEQEVFVNAQRTADWLMRDLEEILKDAHLSPTQYNVLRILRGAGASGLPTGEVGDRMVASREPDVTRLLVRMEERGLVERERRTDNRRFVVVRITVDGLRMLKALDGPVASMHATQLRHMNRRELELLAELLERARREGNGTGV